MASENNAVDFFRAPLILQATRHLVELVSSSADVIIDHHSLPFDTVMVFQFQSFGVLSSSLYFNCEGFTC